MPYRELWAYQNLQNTITQIQTLASDRLLKGNKGDKEEKDRKDKVKLVNDQLITLVSLGRKLKNLYATDLFEDNYKIMTGQDVTELQQLYQNSITAVENLKNILFSKNELKGKQARELSRLQSSLRKDQTIVNRIDARNGLSLPGSVYMADEELKKRKKEPGEFKWPGFREYARIYSTADISEDDLMRFYIQKTPGEVKADYEAGIKANPHLYEYTANMSLPPRIRTTGNEKEISDYLTANQNNLTFPEKHYLETHLQAIQKAKTIQKNAETAMNQEKELVKPLKLVLDKPGRVELDVHMPALQSSGSGCWSCATQLLLQGRGVKDVSQEDIRAYRPELPEQELVLNNAGLDAHYNRDRERSIMENADAFMKFAPNSMLHELEIEGYTAQTDKDGFSFDQYLDNAVKLLKKQIEHAIRVDRSPVAFLRPGHFITITGIDGDTVKFKDSKRAPGDKKPADYTFKESLKTLVGSVLNHSLRADPIQIVWASDIKLAKDGKSIHGVPSEYVYMNPDGTVKPQPDVMRQLFAEPELDSLTRNGIRVVRPSGDEASFSDHSNVAHYGKDGVGKIERVYLPKKLNAVYLQKMMKKRPDAEEKKLAEDDKAIYNIKEGKKTEADPRLAEMLKHEQDVEAGKKDDGRFVIPPEKEPKKEPEKTEEKKEKKEEKLNYKLPPVGTKKRSADDTTTLKGTASAFTRVLLDAKSKEGEKALANEVAGKYDMKAIRDTADRLIRDLNGTIHFYLVRTYSSYKEMRTHLEKVRRLADKGVPAAPGAKVDFSEKDAKELADAIAKAGRAAKSYLSSKYSDMMKDPRRRNDPGKQDYEQPRIKVALDTYDKVLEIQIALKAKKKEGGLKIDQDDREALVEHFRKELVADPTGPVRMQEESRINRVVWPKGYDQGIDRIEAIFGATYKEIPALSGAGDLQKVKNAPAHFRPIGEAKEDAYLSDKDFVALAAGSRSFNTLLLAVKGDAKDMSRLVNTVNTGKNQAVQALTAYENGDNEPLARLIAAEINNIAAGGRQTSPEKPEIRLCLSEIGQRLTGILNRDPELMKKALSEGLEPKALKEIKNIEIEGRYACMADRWKERAKGLRGDRISSEEKVERYVDLLMERYLAESEKNARDTRTANGVHDTISEPGMETRIRTRIRNYITANGFDTLSPKQFVNRVYNKDAKNSLRKMDVITDVNRAETRDIVRKSRGRHRENVVAVNPVKKEGKPEAGASVSGRRSVKGIQKGK